MPIKESEAVLTNDVLKIYQEIEDHEFRIEFILDEFLTDFRENENKEEYFDLKMHYLYEETFMTHKLYFEKGISFFDVKTFNCRVIAGKRLNKVGKMVYGLLNFETTEIKRPNKFSPHINKFDIELYLPTDRYEHYIDYVVKTAKENQQIDPIEGKFFIDVKGLLKHVSVNNDSSIEIENAILNYRKDSSGPMHDLFMSEKENAEWIKYVNELESPKKQLN